MLVAFGVSACEREPQSSGPTPASGSVETVVPTQASKPALVVPRPSDQAQLDRMILAGYTPHADHLHAPGVNECPMSKGSEAVM